MNIIYVSPFTFQYIKQSKHYNINPKDEGTWNDRGRDGGTKIILRIKEQETRLTLYEDDDEVQSER